MTPDEQEALSRKYSDDVIILLPLASGRIAVFNNARALCGFVEPIMTAEAGDIIVWQDVTNQWTKPAAAPKRSVATLEELGLL